jgi:hypothetical protein
METLSVNASSNGKTDTRNRNNPAFKVYKSIFVYLEVGLDGFREAE